MADAESNRLILASASPARRELLGRLQLPFEVIPADIDEPTTGFGDPRTFVASVAWLKATRIAEQIQKGPGGLGGAHPNSSIILAADTIGWIDGEPILKPADEQDARRIFRRLGGRTHELWTGVVLWRRPDDLQMCWQERSLVIFRDLSDREIDEYLATRSWRGHSGGYAIEEQGDPHVRVVEGSITNVIGLPMESLAIHLNYLRTAPTPETNSS